MSVIYEHRVEFSRGVVIAKRNEAWTMTLTARWALTWSVPTLFTVIDPNTFNRGDILVLLEEILEENRTEHKTTYALLSQYPRHRVKIGEGAEISVHTHNDINGRVP
jgi:hypothetical protein